MSGKLTLRQLSAATGAILVGVAMLVALPWLRLYLGTGQPLQYYRALSAPPHTFGRQLLGVAHNAGNNAATEAKALDYHAEVIEIDVVMVHGVLSAGRDRPWRWLADNVFEGPTLADAWQEAAGARIVQLDLQQNDRPLLNALIDFLRRVPTCRPTMVSTRDPEAMQYLAPRVSPSVTPVLSVPSPDAVSRLRNDAQLSGAIGGISVYHELVDDSLVAWAHTHDILVLAWPVDDTEDLRSVFDAGVDGVSTDNLAVLEVLAD
jgi:glycerophosphoryl diester phosphodiesterase